MRYILLLLALASGALLAQTSENVAIANHEVAGNEMTITHSGGDPGPGAGGSVLTVPVGTSFDVEVRVTSVGDPDGGGPLSAPYQGDQWELAWTNAVLNVGTGATEVQYPTPFNLCAPPPPSVISGAQEIFGQGAGCASSGGPSLYVGLTTIVNLTCASLGTTNVRLLGFAEDPVFGTTMFEPGGIARPITLENQLANEYPPPAQTAGIVVQCANFAVLSQIHNAAHANITGQSIAIGVSIHQRATPLSATGPQPTGSVDFHRFASSDCTGAPLDEPGVPLASGVAESAPYFPPAGAVSYQAHYNGDVNYAPSDGACNAVTIAQGTAALALAIHDALHTDHAGGSSFVGEPVHGSLSVGGGGPASTGTVTFHRYDNNNVCSGTPTDDAAAIVAGEAESPDFTPLSAPTVLSYQAEYDGDANYLAAVSSCRAVSIIKRTPVTVVQVHDSTHVDVTDQNLDLGTQTHGSISVTGGGATPTGTVDVRRFADESCSGAPVESLTLSLLGGAVETAALPMTFSARSYDAAYSGDAYYDPSSPVCAGVPAPFNILALDADPGSAEIQTTISGFVGGAAFSTDLVVTRAAVPYAGYQWEIQWSGPIQVTAYDEHNETTPFTLCAAPDLIGNRLGNGAGCVAEAGPESSFLGPVTTFTLSCTNEGPAALHLMATGESFYPTTTLAQTGSAVNTNLADISVECVVPNADGDACSDLEENGTNPNAGGDRDYLNPWDFFDVPVPALRAADTSGVVNRLVSLGDVLAVLYYVGSADDAGPNINGVDYDTDLNANSVEDGVEYDRTPSTTPGKPWRSGPPNGAVGISDALVALAQVGDNCQPPP